jgi:hypothetical protein
MKGFLPVPTAILVAVVFGVLGVLAWKGVPGTAVAITGAFTTLIAGLMRGFTSEPEIVRDASMRPPPAGETEIIEVIVPSYHPPKIEKP